MSLPGVLVLGSSASKEIADIVFEAGLAPVIRESMRSALRGLRRDGFTGIVVDSTRARADLLEFILNVRDFSSTMRIFVVCRTPKQAAKNIPETLGHVFFVTQKDLGEKLKPPARALPRDGMAAPLQNTRAQSKASTSGKR